MKFSSIGHFFATAAHAISKAAKAVVSAAPKVGAEAQKLEPVVEAGTRAALGPGLGDAAVAFERLAFQLLGNGVAVVAEAKDATDAKGMSIPLDESVIADLKSLAPQLEALFAAFGVSKPTDVPVTAPAK